MKRKSEMLKVVKKWYSDIAVLRQKNKLLVAMRDNAGENKSQEIVEFFESMGIKNYYSTEHEQWQNGLPEARINAIMMVSRTILLESGLGCRFLFKSAMEGCDARNVTHKERIGPIPWRLMHGENMYPDFAHSFAGHGFISTKKEQKTENIRCGQLRQSTLDSSAYLFFITKKNTMMSSNKAKFDETVFQFQKKKMVEQLEYP